MRELFKENVHKPIKHPLGYSSFNRQVMGAPWAPDSGILITGVGCANKCRFCATSHFFGTYVPYLKTGKEIFDLCCRYEEEMHVTDFGVLDENFLKMKDRALELLELMERNQRRFTFAIFSSAETLKELGDLDILVRLGVTFIWVGVESKNVLYAKNKNTDFSVLISELKKRGISVLASSILFNEEHDKNTIWEDVDYVTSLKPDYVQFAPLGPIPGTKLYEDYEEQGKVIHDIPYRSQHGQGKIWFRHDHFSREESEEFLRLAFEIDYNRNGASMLRGMRTTLNGYTYCRNHPDEAVRRRSEGFKKRLKIMRYFLTASTIFVQNRQSEILLEGNQEILSVGTGHDKGSRPGHIPACRLLQRQGVLAMSPRWGCKDAEDFLSSSKQGVCERSQTGKCPANDEGCIQSGIRLVATVRALRHSRSLICKSPGISVTSDETLRLRDTSENVHSRLVSRCSSLWLRPRPFNG